MSSPPSPVQRQGSQGSQFGGPLAVFLRQLNSRNTAASSGTTLDSSVMSSTRTAIDPSSGGSVAQCTLTAPTEGSRASSSGTDRRPGDIFVAHSPENAPEEINTAQRAASNITAAANAPAANAPAAAVRPEEVPALPATGAEAVQRCLCPCHYGPNGIDPPAWPTTTRHAAPGGTAPMAAEIMQPYGSFAPALHPTVAHMTYGPHLPFVGSMMSFTPMTVMVFLPGRIPVSYPTYGYATYGYSTYPGGITAADFRAATVTLPPAAQTQAAAQPLTAQLLAAQRLAAAQPLAAQTQAAAQPLVAQTLADALPPTAAQLLPADQPPNAHPATPVIDEGASTAARPSRAAPLATAGTSRSLRAAVSVRSRLQRSSPTGTAAPSGVAKLRKTAPIGTRVLLTANGAKTARTPGHTVVARRC